MKIACQVLRQCSPWFAACPHIFRPPMPELQKLGVQSNCRTVLVAQDVPRLTIEREPQNSLCSSVYQRLHQKTLLAPETCSHLHQISTVVVNEGLCNCQCYVMGAHGRHPRSTSLGRGGPRRFRKLPLKLPSLAQSLSFDMVPSPSPSCTVSQYGAFVQRRSYTRNLGANPICLSPKL